MGCWNGTCMVSNLPIMAGDKVVAFLISQPPFFDVGAPTREHGPSIFWRPISPPIRAEYNDYGYIENIELGPAPDLALSILRKRLVERDLGENAHDHEVRKADLTFETLGEWLHGHRVQIVNEMGNYDEYLDVLAIEIVMIHASIFDELVEIGPDDWRHDERQSLAAAKHAFVEEMVESSKTLFPTRERRAGEAMLLDEVRNTLIDPVLGYAPEGRTEEKVRALLAGIDPVIDDIVALRRMDMMLDALRKHWTPMQGAGSQDADYESYRYLMKAMDAVITKAQQYDDD
jgi:hypothetical protein